ncbi:hypothetical protein [Bacillus fonticola]|uniref:hypothetical protein n=1 Tax=Bacillus fonticola TaxID=2728853 RepID=UPI001475A49B|nr:hypothetical protein [Bacillus fonticola]
MKSKVFIILSLMLMLPFLLSPDKTFADGKYPVRIIDQSIIATPISENTIQLVQIMTFNNSGENKEEQLPIYLPEGYSDLQLQSGLEETNMQVTEKGIVDTTGLDAGKEKRIIITYNMPLIENISQWSLETAYVVEMNQIIIQPGVFSFQANNLITQSDLFEMNGQEFRRFTRADLHPDTPWTLGFTYIGGTSGQENSNPVAESSPSGFTEDGYKILGDHGEGYGKAIITILIIIVALTMTLIGLKRDNQQSNNNHVKPKRTWLKTEKELLLKDMVQLEKDYQSRIISEKTYTESYADIKEKIKRIIAELR